MFFKLFADDVSDKRESLAQDLCRVREPYPAQFPNLAQYLLKAPAPYIITNNSQNQLNSVDLPIFFSYSLTKLQLFICKHCFEGWENGIKIGYYFGIKRCHVELSLAAK